MWFQEIYAVRRDRQTPQSGGLAAQEPVVETNRIAPRQSQPSLAVTFLSRRQVAVTTMVAATRSSPFAGTTVLLSLIYPPTTAGPTGEVRRVV